MAQICLPAGCVDAIRVALIDECTGARVLGATNGYVLNCIRNVTLTPNVTEGDETILENACGTKCWQTRKCDRLDNITVELELLNPDYEFTNLINGNPLLVDGGNNAGYYTDEDNTCHPWFCVEIFEQIPAEACDANYKYRRIILPKVRFQPVSFTTEDPFRLVSLSGITAPVNITVLADGPFNDSPIDFTTLPVDARTQYVEFQDSNITTALTGNCGFIPVVETGVVLPTINGVTVTP